MFKIAALIWLMAGTALAGVVMTVIVTLPELADSAAWLIPVGCVSAFLFAVPLSYVVARRISAPKAA